MNKFLKIIILTSILLFSSCVNDSNPKEFTVREYKKIRKEITEYFENEGFTCKNEVDKYEEEAWLDSQGSESNKKYIEPTVCRKITEKKIDSNVYKSEIKYELITYDWMVYLKEQAKSDQFKLDVKNYTVPKEKYLNEQTSIWFQQATCDDFMNLFVDKYDEEAFETNENRYIYITLSSLGNDNENYKYFQQVFKSGLTNELNEQTINIAEKKDYFELIVEKGYANKLLSESQISKEEADEIAKRFEKSEIYDKIYNLKY